ncbi:MAG: Uma2 family endonuclease [Pyrinomonadaceae bacterium]
MRAEKQIPQRYTVEEYLRMERAADVRHEYLDGEIFEMAGESLAHGRHLYESLSSNSAQS